VNVVLLALVEPHRDVHDGLIAVLLRSRGSRRRCRRLRRRRRPRRPRRGRRIVRILRVVRERILGRAREFEIAAGPVGLARLLEPLPDLLLVEPLAFFELEHGAQPLALHDGVAREVDRADPVPLALGDGNLQLHPARPAVLLVFQDAELRLADLRLHVPVLAVELLDLVGVFLELPFLERAALAHEEQPLVRPLVLLHLLRQRGVGDRGVAHEVDGPDADLGAFGDMEAEVDRLGRRTDRLDLRLHVGVLIALLGVEVADDAGDLLDEAGIDEGVERDPDPLLLQLVVDFRHLDFLRADVVDNLDALSLLHVVHDDLADHAVREHVVDGLG
jgi:hypothetical protein